MRNQLTDQQNSMKRKQLFKILRGQSFDGFAQSDTPARQAIIQKTQPDDVQMRDFAKAAARSLRA